LELFIGKVCSIERVTKDKTIRFMTTYDKQLLWQLSYSPLSSAFKDQKNGRTENDDE